ncbi:hypothetical protein WDU94_008783 [Cyamophila willieti]
MFAVQVNAELESNPGPKMQQTFDKLGTDSEPEQTNVNDDRYIPETKSKNLEDTNNLEVGSISDTLGNVNNVEKDTETHALKDEIIKQYLLKEIQTPAQASSDIQHDEKQKVLRHLLSNMLSNSNDQGNGTEKVEDTLNRNPAEESSMKSEIDGTGKKESVTENDGSINEFSTTNNGTTNLSNQLSKIPIQQLIKTSDGFIPQVNPNEITPNTNQDENNKNVDDKNLDELNAIPKDSLFAIPQLNVNRLTTENPLQNDKQAVENGDHTMTNEENKTNIGEIENAGNDGKNNSSNNFENPKNVSLDIDNAESKRLSTDTEILTSDRNETKENTEDGTTTPSTSLLNPESKRLSTDTEILTSDRNDNKENTEDGTTTPSTSLLNSTILAVPVNLNNSSLLNDLEEKSIANLSKNISGMTIDQIQSLSDQDILNNLEENQKMDTNVFKRFKSNPNVMREYISPPERIPYINPLPNRSASTNNNDNDIGIKPVFDRDSTMANLLVNNPFIKTPTDTSDVDPRILKSMSDAELQVSLISLLVSMTPSQSNQVTLEPTGYGTFQTYIGDVDLNIELVPIQSNPLTRKNAKAMFKDVSKVVGNINSKLPPGTDQVIKAVIKSTVPGGSEAIAVGELVAKVAKKQKEANKSTSG